MCLANIGDALTAVGAFACAVPLGSAAPPQEPYLRSVLRQVLSAKLLQDLAALAASVNVFSRHPTTNCCVGASSRNLRSSDLITVRAVSTGISTAGGATVADVDQNQLRVLSWRSGATGRSPACTDRRGHPVDVRRSEWSG